MFSVGIIFYSLSGNTRNVCQFIQRHVSTVGMQAQLLEIKPCKEEMSFIRQGIMARQHAQPELREINFDVGMFDFVIVASPVWAFTFAPALRSYLARIHNAANKRAACFLTCGAAFASGNALKELEETLRTQQMHTQFSSYIRGIQSLDEAYLAARFKTLFEIIRP